MTSLAILLIAANSIAFVCPSTIRDEQRVVSPRMDAFSIDKKPRHFEAMRVYSERPETLTQLVPDTHSHPDKNVWNFKPDGANVWVECTYKRSAAALQFRVENAGKCVFVHNMPNGGDKRIAYCTRLAP